MSGSVLRGRVGGRVLRCEGVIEVGSSVLRGCVERERFYLQ